MISVFICLKRMELSFLLKMVSTPNFSKMEIIFESPCMLFLEKLFKVSSRFLESAIML